MRLPGFKKPRAKKGDALMTNTILLKLDDGEDIVESVKKLAQENSIEYGVFVAANGTIKDCELVYNEPKQGITKGKFKEEFKIRAISGQIERIKGNEVKAVIRVSLLGARSGSKSGELLKGKASRALEIQVRKVNVGKIIK